MIEKQFVLWFLVLSFAGVGAGAGVGARAEVRQVVLAGNQECMEEIMQLKLVEILLPVDAGEVIIAHIFIKVTESTRIGDVLMRVGQIAGKVETRWKIGGSTCRV